MLHATTPQVEEPPTHRYLSTACLHGDHIYCTMDQGMNGAKKPATCKFCDARCVCACHPWSPTAT